MYEVRFKKNNFSRLLPTTFLDFSISRVRFSTSSRVIRPVTRLGWSLRVKCFSQRLQGRRDTASHFPTSRVYTTEPGRVRLSPSPLFLLFVFFFSHSIHFLSISTNTFDFLAPLYFSTVYPVCFQNSYLMRSLRSKRSSFFQVIALAWTWLN